MTRRSGKQSEGSIQIQWSEGELKNLSSLSINHDSFQSSSYKSISKDDKSKQICFQSIKKSVSPSKNPYPFQKTIQKKQQNSISKYLNYNQRNDSYQSLFGNQDTLINLVEGDVMQGDQFMNMFDQSATPLEKINRQKAKQKFYGKNNQEGNWGLYYTQYLQWKQSAERNNNLIIPHIESNDGPSLTEIGLEKQLVRGQWRNLKDEENKNIQEKRIRNMKKELSQISVEYKNKMGELLKTKNFRSTLNNPPAQQKPQNKLQISKIESLSFHTQQDNKQEQYKKKNKDTPIYIQYTSYANLIRCPPPKSNQNLFSSNLIQNKERQQIIDRNNLQKSSILKQKNEENSHLVWRLDIDQILKLPHRSFIVFYSQNQRKIQALSTRQQLTRLNNYLQVALQRQQTLQKLRQKIRIGGDDILKKLNPQKKRKLFQLLYEGELEKQIENLQRFNGT